MNRNNKVLGVALALVMILLGINSQRVEATPFNFLSANVSFTGGPPYGSVDVTADPSAGMVTFVVTALTGASDTLGKFGFNTDLVLSAANFTTVPTNWTLGSGQMDGYGKFVWTVGNSANANRVHQATIVISGLSPSQATEAHFEINNADNHMFAAHLFQPRSSLTGFIDNATLAHAPEPATMLLLGSGLIGLAGIARKKFKR